ncbi:MAG: DUF1080 domain-containing protein [Planctomycetales bacterium]|nr:DUF1080 domain-containing protein [Planctomycetales bacterium]
MLKRSHVRLALFFAAIAFPVNSFGADGWVSLFDGKSFDGWKINENPETWKIEDGAMVCHGERSHVFYVGNDKPFVNFEFQADVMTKPGSNAGIYFHTKYQDTGWPKGGFEAQVNNSHHDPKRTASLYAVDNVLEAPAKDNEWFTMTIRVEGKHVTIGVNGKTLTDYTEPADAKPGKDFERVVSSGTFALQGHDPNSTVYFKNLKVRRLP